MQRPKYHKNDKLESSLHYQGHLQTFQTLQHYSGAQYAETHVNRVLERIN